MTEHLDELRMTVRAARIWTVKEPGNPEAATRLTLVESDYQQQLAAAGLSQQQHEALVELQVTYEDVAEPSPETDWDEAVRVHEGAVRRAVELGVPHHLTPMASEVVVEYAPGVSEEPVWMKLDPSPELDQGLDR
jgi:hypothetical protein